MIPVQNIYYMLSYAFHVLNEQGYRDAAAEPFDNVAGLCAAILARGVSAQIRRGLRREYIGKKEPMSALRGRLDLSESVRARTMLRRQMVCSYDEFSENSYLNRILKATMELLLCADIAGEQKKELRRLLLYFRGTDRLDVRHIDWNMRYDRGSQTYRMLISVCYLAVKGLLQTQADGSVRLMDFVDEQRMSRLYEKFLLEYYRKKFPQLSPSPSHIPWALDDGYAQLLPVMRSDVMLSDRTGRRVLIIDAKYYSNVMRQRYDTEKLRSENLYQIFAYVKNQDAAMQGSPHEVAGMLLYAGTDERVQPDVTYRMSGNDIMVRTLRLDQDFSGIAGTLDEIVKSWFGLPQREDVQNGFCL